MEEGWLARQIAQVEYETYKRLATIACSVFFEHKKCQRPFTCECSCHEAEQERNKMSERDE